jgi:hypothetical protein
LIQRQLRDHVVRLLGEDVQLRRIGHGEVRVQFDSRRLSVAELLPYSVLRDRVERRWRRRRFETRCVPRRRSRVPSRAPRSTRTPRPGPGGRAIAVADFFSRGS